MEEPNRRGLRIGQTGIVVALTAMSFNLGLQFGRSGRADSDVVALGVIFVSVIVLLAATIFTVWRSDR